MTPRDWEDDDDRDAPQDIDLDWRDAEDETISCPQCRKPVHEEAALCPHCGQWILGEGEASKRSRRWRWPILVSVLVATILVLWHGLGR